MYKFIRKVYRWQLNRPTYDNISVVFNITLAFSVSYINPKVQKFKVPGLSLRAVRYDLTGKDRG